MPEGVLEPFTDPVRLRARSEEDGCTWHAAGGTPSVQMVVLLVTQLLLCVLLAVTNGGGSPAHSWLAHAQGKMLSASQCAPKETAAKH